LLRARKLKLKSAQMKLYLISPTRSKPPLASSGNGTRLEREIAIGFSPRLVSLRGEMRKVIGGDVAGDVIAVEARRFEIPDPRVRGANR